MAASADILLSSPGLALVLATAALWLAVRPQSPAARRFLYTSAAAYLAATMYVVPAGIARVLLTRQLRPLTSADVPAGRTTIVILGAGGGTVRAREGQVGIMNFDTAARMLEGYRVYRLTGAERIISSGGLVTQARPNETSAEMMRDWLIARGVPGERILVESESQDTHEEAVAIGPMLRRLGAEHVVLVTSDIHMPRAAATFRATGVDVIAAIAADARLPTTIRGWITPTSHGLEYTDRVLHELIGYAYYWARGWLASDVPPAAK